MDNKELDKIEQKIEVSDSDKLDEILKELKTINERKNKEEEYREEHRTTRSFYIVFREIVVLLACVMISLTLFMSMFG